MSRRKIETSQDLEKRVNAFFEDRERDGLPPDLPSMLVSLGISETTMKRYCTQNTVKDPARAERYGAVFARAGLRRQAWFLAEMIRNPKATQACIAALRQPANGGWIDRPQADNGPQTVKVIIAGVGVGAFE